MALLGACVAILVVRSVRGGARILVVRIVATIALSATIGTLTGFAALAGPVGTLTAPTGWTIAACDIGQGDAVLVRSEGRVALIDTGPDPARLSACLSRLGIGRIDLLVLTHYDLDHVGGTSAVVGRVDVVLHGPSDGAAADTLMRRLGDGGAHLVDAHTGMHGMLGAAAWRVVWPRAQSRGFAPGNDSSVVLDIRGGGVPASVYLGDLSASSQAALAASGELRPPYRVVKVAHHGSADQDPGLYALLRPSVALISVGLHNDYGHPRAETLAFLTALGATIARTDRSGLVAISDATAGVALWRERADPSPASVSGPG